MCFGSILVILAASYHISPLEKLFHKRANRRKTLGIAVAPRGVVSPQRHPHQGQAAIRTSVQRGRRTEERGGNKTLRKPGIH